MKSRIDADSLKIPRHELTKVLELSRQFAKFLQLRIKLRPVLEELKSEVLLQLRNVLFHEENFRPIVSTFRHLVRLE